MSLDIRSDHQPLGIRLLASSPLRWRAWRRALMLLTALPLAAAAQRPDPAARVAERLPAAQGVTVRQTSPSEITLTWKAVANAKSYVIGRAVGTGGYLRMPDASKGPDTVYVDRALTVGARHRYTITPISLMDLSGLRATSDSIVPTGRGPIMTESVEPRISARLMIGRDIRVSWQAPGVAGIEYYVRHRLNGSKMAFQKLISEYFVFYNVPEGSHEFELVQEGRFLGSQKVVARSEMVTVTAAGVGPGGIPATPTTASTSGTTALVPTAAAIPLRIGATIKASAAGRWSSLDPAIATVAVDGTVTGRAIGTTQIVAHAVEPDGAIRVTVVRVDVQP